MKSLKQWIFILIALIMIGAVAVVIVLNKDEKRSKGITISDSKVFSEEIKEVVVEVGACEFELMESTSGETRLEYDNVMMEYFIGEVEDGVLTIRYEPKGQNITVNFFGIKFGGGMDSVESKIVLQIPKDVCYEKVTMKFGAADVKAEQIAAKQLMIEVGAGRFEADTVLAENEANISVGAGAFYASEVALANAELHCGVGEMEMTGSVTGKSFVECGVGEVELVLEGNEEDYCGELDCGLGEIVFGDMSIGGSGKKDFGVSDAAYQMDVKCGVGEVEIRFE